MALCIRELSERILNRDLAEKGTSLTVRVFVEQGRKVVIRLRDDGMPLNFDDRQRLDSGQARAVAREINYRAAYGMNNTTAVI